MNAKFVAALAVVFAVVAGTAAAGPAAKKLLTGKDIKDGSIGIVDLSSKTRVGLKGARGPAGPQGNNGASGAKGDTGPAGSTGPAGPTGATGTQGAQGAQGAQGLKGDKGDQGTPGLIGVWRGAYSSGTTYALNDVVSFNGASWISRSDGNLTHTPGTTADWQLVADKGATGVQGPKGDQGVQGIQGQAGVIGAWKGPYLAGTTYALNDVVSSGGSSWISKSAGNVGHTPGTTGDWEMVAGKGDAGAAGAKGDKGDKGDTGAAGAQGIQGPKGDTGASGGLLGYEVYAEPQPTVEAGTFHDSTITCPSGKKALGGGIVATGPTEDPDYRQYVAMTWSGPSTSDATRGRSTGSRTTQWPPRCASSARLRRAEPRGRGRLTAAPPEASSAGQAVDAIR